VTRYVIAVGTSDYGAGLDLPFATHDADRVVRLLTQRFGYTQALLELAHNPSTDVVRRQFGRWLRGVNADDVVVFYYAGHGDKSADGRHYLLCADSEFDALASTALATDDLLRLWSDAGRPVENLLFVLDVCYAGAGVAQLEVVAKDLAAVRRREEAEGIWVLAAARTRDEAEESLFVDTLERAVDTAKAGQRARFLAIDDVVDTINADLAERGRSQRAVCLPRFTRRVPPFLPNPKHWPDAPPEGVDLATQRKLRRLDLEQHFEPRARGVERGSDLGSLFCGRARVLAELNAWLADGDGRACVVTGSPGVGKSAVLGKVVMTAEPDLAIHARKLRLDQIVAAFAGVGIEASDVDAVLLALRERTDPLLVVVDALDEAIGPDTIARNLLRPMSTIRSVRLLVGTRPEHLAALRPAIVEIDLDLPEYTGATDIAGYVAKILLAEDDPHQPTPYRGSPGLARTVAEGVSTRAHNNFLIARMHALHLVYAPEPVDVTVPGWQKDLKSDVGAVFDDYISRFGGDAARVRRLLTTLAYAEGQGLPWDDIWAPLATVLSGVTSTDEDIAWLLDHANSYIVEAAADDRSVYRLYHQALADHLRRLPAAEAHRRIVRTLRPDDPFGANPYIRRHLAQHAAAAGQLDDLIADPAFVLSTDLGALLSALPAVTTPAGELIAAVIQQTMPFWPEASHLQLAARRYGADDFADRVPNLTWSTPWADIIPRTPHRVLGTGDVGDIAVADMPQHGPVVVVSFRNGVVAVLDVEDGHVLNMCTFSGAATIGIAPVAQDEHLIVLIVVNGEAWRWNVTTGEGVKLTTPFYCKNVWSTMTDNGEVIGLFSNRDGAIQVYDVTSDQMLEVVPPPREDGHHLELVAAADAGRTTLFAGYTFDEGASTFDLSGRAWRPLPLWDVRPANSVVISEAFPHLVFCSSSYRLTIRDIRTGRFLGETDFSGALAAGTLSTGQVVLLLESTGTGVWAADDVIESSGAVPTGRNVDALLAAALKVELPAEHTAMTLAEFVAAAHHDPGRLGLVGPAIAADVTLPSGDRLFATCDSDGRVKFWSATGIAAGAPVMAAGRQTNVRSPEIDLDCWEPAPLSPRQTLAGFDGRISSAVFTRRSGGQDVVITVGEDGFIRRWDVHLDGASQPASTDRLNEVDAVAVQGDWIVHISRNSSDIRARTLADGTLAPTTLPGPFGREFFVVENAPSACLVVDASHHAHLLSWGNPLVPLTTEVRGVAASMRSDGTLVVVSTDYAGVTRVHRLTGGELSLLASERLELHDDYRTATLRTGETVIVAAARDVLKIWNADSLTLRAAVGLEDLHGFLELLATGKLPDGRAVALVTARSQCALIDLDEGRRLGGLPGADRLSLAKFRVLDDGRHLFVGARKSNTDVVTVWDLERMSLIASIKVPMQVNDLDMSPDGVVVLATPSGLTTIRL
jgi:WD40 repeat protein